MNQLAHIDRDGPVAVAVASGPRALLPEFITKLILERSRAGVLRPFNGTEHA
jgi:hypothetical protein